MTGPAAHGMRMSYDQLPPSVRAYVNEHCGGVAGAVDHPTGFSPGVAATVTTSAGQLLFVKAVSAEVNAITRDMHRREAKNLTLLAETGAAPRLIATLDEEPWTVLVTEHIAGDMPALPWSDDDVRVLVRTADDLARVTAPTALPPLADEFATAFTGWRSLAREGVVPSFLPADFAGRIDALAAIEHDWIAVAEGDALVHGDIRGDNLLIERTPEQARGRLVDWPFACRGNPLLDVVGAAGALAMQGGPAPAKFVASTTAGRSASTGQVRALVIAATGYLVNAARQPPPPGLPTLRAFQRAQAELFYDWLRALL